MGLPGLTRVQADKRYTRSTFQAQGAVCFTYDDANISMRTTAAALAAARGQRNTFFITTDQLGGGGKITSADVAALYAAGHEIGAHSKDHTSITSIGTVAGRVIQYDTPKTVLEGIVGAGNVKSWAYPFGNRGPTSDRELWLRYNKIFATGYATQCVIPMEDRRERFLYGRQQWTQDTHSTVLDLIRQAHRSPVVVLIYCHDPGNTSGAFATDPTPTQVAEAYDLCVSLGVPSTTVSDALGGGELLRNPGFENGLTGWQQPLGAVAGLTVESLTDTADAAIGSPGTKSLHIGATAPTAANFVIEQTIPIRPGVLSYNWGARWRAANMAAGQLQFDFQRLAYDGSQIATTASVLSTNGAWGNPTRAVTLEATCVAVNLKFTVPIGFQGDVYLDHMDFRPTHFGQFS